GGRWRVLAGEPPEWLRERRVGRTGLRHSRVRAVDGGDEPGDGFDRPVHCIREYPGHRGHSQDAEAADAHQCVHRVAGERGSHHGYAGGAVWRRARGAWIVAVRLVFLRVLDLRGCPVRHRQHRDSVRNCHRQVLWPSPRLSAIKAC
ncbi:Endosialin, partial [Larimichthys crocea]